MKVCVQNGKLKGNISVPGSKSLTIRALILAAMSYGITEISNPLESQDCLSTLNAITKIGAKLISKEKGKWIIQGAADNLHLPDGNIDVGNSGSLLYFLTPVLSTLKGECIFTGDESICKRPVSHLIDALQQMGAQAKCLKNKDCPPFSFCGPITSKKILNTEGKLSQYISGFMMASSKMDGELQINLSNPQETPYLTMTQTVLKEVGIESTISTDYKKINVKCGKKIEGFKTTIASDWEGVAFPLVAALVSGSSIKIENIDFSGTQGDDKIVEVLQSVGAKITCDKENKCLIVESSGGTECFSTKKCPGGVLTVDISSFPDAICAVSAFACFIDGKIVITNAEICRKKETDRITAMKTELSKIGAVVEEKEDSLIIYGTKNGENLHGAQIESYKDHRIAMAFASISLGLKAGESVIINDGECANVSFPDFYETMNKLGAGFVTI